MKITKLSLCISMVGVLATLPVAYANEVVTNCTQVSSVENGDTNASNNESCAALTIPFDYGDAPDPSFVTLSASEGARHQLGTGVYLGKCVDADSGLLQGSASADDGDEGQPVYGTCDTDASGKKDDEDGMAIGELRVGDAKVVVQATASAACKLNAWVDWNQDGSWGGSGEQIFYDKPLDAGVNNLTLDVPAFAKEGAAYARFRCSTKGGDGIGGEAADGEVEDYALTILPPKVVEETVSVGDYIWIDDNKNGQIDHGEPALKGAIVTLLHADGTVVERDGLALSVSIGSDGYYLFDKLPEGDYMVRVEPPAGYQVTVGGAGVDDDPSNTDNNCQVVGAHIQTQQFNLTAGQEPDTAADGNDTNSNLTVDCGFYKSVVEPGAVVAVGNLVWLDENGNGIQDEGEKGLPNAVVTLTDATGNGVTDANGKPVGSYTTGNDGLYSFNNLLEGDYIVTVAPPAGYSLTKGGTDPDEDESNTDSNCKVVDGRFQTAAITLTAGKEPDAKVDGDDANSNSTVDCGMIRPVNLGSRIWIDLDGNGKQDGGEPGVPGALITLLTPDGQPVKDLFGNPVAPQTTDADGKYLFTDLREGSYVVKVTPPPGYLPTIVVKDPNNDDGNDSNGIPTGDGSVISQPLSLKWGEEPSDGGATNTTLGFGFVANLQIPTLGEWGVLLMSMLLATAAFFRRRRED